MKIAIVDDSKSSRDAAAAAIAEGFHAAGIAITELLPYEDGASFLRHFTAGRFDLVILDILMGGLSGTDVAAKIRETDTEVRLVFCTTSNDFASEAFGVNASDYILKPVSVAAVREMIERLNLAQLVRNRYLVLPDGQRVLLRSILYVECVDHLLYFYLTNGSVMRSRLQQARLLEYLAPFPEFFCCAKGVIINFNHVANRTDNTFVMTNGTPLPISRRRAKETLAAFENHLFDLLKKEEA